MILDLLFPPRCLTCKEDTPNKALLCPSCLSYLQLLRPEGRCPRCFGSPSPHDCKKSGLTRQAFCFEPSPLISALYKKELHKLLTSYLLIQLTELKWEVDSLTALPLHPLRRLSPASFPDTLLSKALAKELALPYKQFLTPLSDETFALKRGTFFTGETLLLVGFYKSSLTRQAMRLLKDAGPCRILGLYISRRGERKDI